MDFGKLDFEFDLQGFCVLRGLLPRDAVDRLNERIVGAGLEASAAKFHFLELDDMFIDLVFTREVLELAERWIGNHFRFDHAWGVHYPPSSNAGRENLHAGPFQNQGFFQYHWYNNRPRTSCVIASYVLQDQLEGEGGLVILSGSHKLNIPLDGLDPTVMVNRVYGGDLATVPGLVQPILKAGDVLLMAEATVHGTVAWRSNKTWRRNLYYKYCCGFMGWLPQDTSLTHRLQQRAQSDEQKRVLDIPYVSKLSGNTQQWRPRTLEASAAK